MQLTKAENGVNGFAWSQDGKSIAFTASDADQQGRQRPQRASRRFRGRAQGVYTHSHLWTLDVAEALKAPVAGTQRTQGQRLQRRLVLVVARRHDDRLQRHGQPGPDSGRDLGHLPARPRRRLGQEARRAARAGQQSAVVARRQTDRLLVGDGQSEVLSRNSRLAVVSVEGGTPRSITDAFDEQPGFVEWNADGIYFGGLQKTASHLFRVDPATGKITRVTAPDNLMAGGFSFTSDGKQMAFTAASPTSLNEVFVTPVAGFAPRKLTSMTDQTKDFTLGTREVISWKSQDGATIEGVLIKPADFDPSKKYPLLCVIHGGPTGIDRPTLLDARYYPTDIWAGARRAGSEGQLSRQRRLRRKVPPAQRPQPGRRRRLGRALGGRSPDRQGLGRPETRSAAWAGARAATSRRS